MNVKRIFVLFTSLTLLVVLNAFAGDVPNLINYQGTLKNASDNPLNGNFKVTFSIYDSVQEGNLLWTETHNPMKIINGHFSILLGGVNPLAPNVFLDGPDRFLEIKLGEDPPLSTRQRFVSIGYAMKASDADTVKGVALVDLQTPKGVIVMWSGSKDNIPKGWVLCDGSSSNIPDLTNRFIIGAGKDYPVDDEGGSPSHNHGGTTGSHTLTVNEMPAHTHKQEPLTTVMSRTLGNFQGMYGDTLGSKGGTTQSTGGGQGHNHTISNASSLPPYYALAFIIKL